MLPAPALDTGHGLRASEIVAVAILAQPPSLTGHLAGQSARLLGAVVLAIGRSRIGNEELVTAAAFSSTRRTAHREPHVASLRRTSTDKKTLEEDVQEAPKRRRKKSLITKCRKKITRKKMDFQTACSHPLSFRR
jgi:hypothetical protein